MKNTDLFRFKVDFDLLFSPINEFFFLGNKCENVRNYLVFKGTVIDIAHQIYQYCESLIVHIF